MHQREFPPRATLQYSEAREEEVFTRGSIPELLDWPEHLTIQDTPGMIFTEHLYGVPLVQSPPP
jgi:hypothetical protein